MLSNITKRLTDMGLTPVVAVELEFYLVDPKRDSKGFPCHRSLPVPASVKNTPRCTQ
ncbi:hypothetical protein [Aliamphritea spongicola]|nr:hypothetical protein [Aliamphritea spongicola]